MEETIPTASRTRADCWADGYWLEHCEAFSVETPAGRLLLPRVADDGFGEDEAEPGAGDFQRLLANSGQVDVRAITVAYGQPPKRRSRRSRRRAWQSAAR